MTKRKSVVQKAGQSLRKTVAKGLKSASQKAARNIRGSKKGK